MSVHSDIANNTWQLDITRRDPNRMPVSKIDWDAQALDPNGKTVPVTVRETGLGRYRADIPLERYEKLTLRVQDQVNDRLKVMHYHRPYPREYALSATVPEPIDALPTFTPASLSEPTSGVKTRQSIAAYFYLAALAFLLLGLVLRRI